jgi:PAS domain S-box-containing protein
MTPVSAWLILPITLAMLLRCRSTRHPALRVIEVAAAGLPLAAGLLLGSQFFFAFPLPSDHWPAPNAATVGGFAVESISPLSLACFILISGALLCGFTTAPRWQPIRSFGGWLSLTALLTGGLIAGGYLVGSPFFYTGSVNPMSWLTAIILILLSAAILITGNTDAWPLYLVFPNHPRNARTTPERSDWALLALFVTLAAGIVLSGLRFLDVRLANAWTAARIDLAAIANLKAQQIAHWRSERIQDGRFFSRAPFVARDIQGLLAAPNNEALRHDITEWLTLLKGDRRYVQATVFAPDLAPRLTVPDIAIPPPTPELAARIGATFQTNVPTLHDLRLSNTNGEIRMDLLVPVFAPAPHTQSQPAAASDAASPIAVIHLDIDPNFFLYPLLESWPNPSRTAETLLVRREDSDVLFLNNLHHQPKAALRFRLPASAVHLPAAQSGRAETEVQPGTDYRGVHVLGAVLPVPDTAWGLVAKIDIAELSAPLRREVVFVGAVTLLLLLAPSLALSALWRRRNERHLVEQLEAERELRKSSVAALNVMEQAAAARRQAELAGSELRLEAAERSRAESALRTSEEQFRTMFDLASIGMAQADPRTRRWLRVNQRLCRITGYSADEMLRMQISEMTHPEDRPQETEAWQHLVEGQTQDYRLETRFLRKDGSVAWVNVNMTLFRDDAGHPTRALAAIEDVTERKDLETSFLRAQRLEGIGALASGLSHDLNNILAPILIAAPLLRRAVADDESRAILDTVESSAHRGADIIRQLLTFARGKPGARVPLPVRHILGEMDRLVRETFPRDIRPRLSVAADLWPVLGDPTQLHQALMNLCVNSRDAMVAGGALSLEAANSTMDEADTSTNPNAKPGRYVRITVTDTGTGIPPEHIDRIFDPFFTTKEVGKGTGLGLPTVLGIVRGHGGFIKVNSRPGHTAFGLFFPASTEVSHESPHPPRPAPPPGHDELVLLVDDEFAVRDALRRTLERHGYRVLTASHGAEGLANFAQHRATIRAVVTDLMMPVMDGPKFIASLRTLDPTLPILGMTGLDDQSNLVSLANFALPPLLTKPFASEALLQALHDTLHPPPNPQPSL